MKFSPVIVLHLLKKDRIWGQLKKFKMAAIFKMATIP